MLHRQKKYHNTTTPFVVSKKGSKVYVKDPIVLSSPAKTFIFVYRRNRFAHGGPMMYSVYVNGVKVDKPLQNGGNLLVGVRETGRHVVQIKMPATGLVNMDKQVVTAELAEGEMHFIEVAVAGIGIPTTKVWDMGKMQCPVYRKEVIPEPTPSPPSTTTTTTTTYVTQAPVYTTYTATYGTTSSPVTSPPPTGGMYGTATAQPPMSYPAYAAPAYSTPAYSTPTYSTPTYGGGMPTIPSPPTSGPAPMGYPASPYPYGMAPMSGGAPVMMPPSPMMSYAPAPSPSPAYGMMHVPMSGGAPPPSSYNPFIQPTAQYSTSSPTISPTRHAPPPPGM